MVRTQIYLDDSQKDQLEKISRRTKSSMAELIRDAVDRYLEEERKSPDPECFRDLEGPQGKRNGIRQARTQGMAALSGVLVDTDVLIEFLRGNSKVKDMLAQELMEGRRLFCSVITEAEILAGLRSGEERSVEGLLEKLESIPVTREIARTAGSLKQKYGKSQGLALPDALIAASAISHRLLLLTRNAKHFRFKEVQLLTRS
jgi:predicted nucleic acid-binding protein